MLETKNTSVLLGLTGGVASGKTTVADYFCKLGAYLIDADVIAREVVSPNSSVTKKIYDLLGSNYFLDDGNLNRSAIKQLIFNDEVIRKQYEAIIMPTIRQAILKALKLIPMSSCYTVLIAPLLFEKELEKYTDFNINVDLPVDEQIQRAIKRKSRDEVVIREIIASQLSRVERNSRADFVIDNSHSLRELYQHLDKLHIEICQLSLKKALDGQTN